MATVNIGSLKFNWKGAYNGSTAYAIDDVTEYNGSSYICILASTGNLPTNTTYFQPMATKGTDGTDVGTTLTTQGDILYRDGSGLQRLGAGTAGQVLKINSGATAPEWGTDIGGKLLQVVGTTITGSVSLAGSSGWQEVTNRNMNFTPTLSTSKVLIIFTFSARSSGTAIEHYTIYRDSTSLSNDGLNSLHDENGASDYEQGTTIMYLDSPNTTSQINYKLYGYTPNTGDSLRINTKGNIMTITAMEIGV